MVASAKNYIHYHQQSLVVQEYIAQHEPAKALALLDKLEKRYGLMPTETFARALCQVAVGDTAAARLSYLESFRQRASLGWIWISPPPFRSVEDSLWYNRVTIECVAFWESRPEYVDGPNSGAPTVVTWANKRHQFLIDSLHAIYGDDWNAEANHAYDQLIEKHDLLLDSIISGKVPVPSIAMVGVNEEFGTLVIHCSPDYSCSKEKYFKRWLKQGLIYPRVYATPSDRRALLDGKPFPYGIYDELKPEDLLPGHEKRRAAIGMGDNRLERIRFHMGG